MWNKPLKKTLYTLNIDDYEPEITALTFPYMRKYAEKIGADFFIITERKFPDWPVTFEKLQIYELAQQHANDWNIFCDGDCLIHPDLMDVTNHISKDTVMHNGSDESTHRFKADRFFLRDGRFIGSCNWFAVASDLCIELWKPPDDLTLEEAMANIQTISQETNGGMAREHLIDDYICSRNISKYGLKFTTLRSVLQNKGYPNPVFMMHMYNIPIASKLDILNQTMVQWGIKKI
jgi:hypothetical protein